MRSDTKRKFGWSGRIELLEDRLVMSADPLGGIFGGAIEHHMILDEPPALDHHVESTPDFWIDSSDQAALEHHQREIEWALEEAHGQTGLTTVRADYGFSGIGQTVAVIDSGIAYDHFALGGGFGSAYRVVGGWDFTGENDADPYDDGPSGSHGTHVAGIVGGDSGNDVGVAPSADLVALRVFDDSGAGYFSWVENALDWIHTNRNTFENPITAVNLSLGVSGWNSETIPAWANLEDEFAQLEADGIFIAVSAGNGYTSYNEPGLSYPAASPYVIPVMSTDDSGLLSYYSQRHQRAIAAPGRSITSTVPDYSGNNNGIADDYGTKSGTSMASPYVAGASVLVREAMEFVGYTNITQDTIYDHMMATADSFFDSATNAWYDRLNLEAAIDALMPADDYGSTIASAYDLGTISDPMAMSGAITTLGDVDYFSFTAAGTGTVTFTASNMTHQLDAAWEVSGGNGSWSGDYNEIFTVEVVGGQNYTVGFFTDNGLGFYDFDITAESTFSFTDWGTVSFSELEAISTVDDTWYRLEAANDGFLTVESLFDGAGGQINLELYNANLDLLDKGFANGGESRVDSYASVGDEFFVRVLGGNSDVDFRLTNLVSFSGTTISVAGTAGDDAYTFVAGDTHELTVNGVLYGFSAIAVSDFHFDGGSGYDSIVLTGTAADETATLRVGDVTFEGTSFTVNVLAVEDVSVFGGGGFDMAHMHDSSGDDMYTTMQNDASMVGSGYNHQVSNFASTYAFASSGNDQAHLHDSLADDSLMAYPTWARLAGPGYYNYAGNFDLVYAYADSGGYDRAELIDSDGDDSFRANPNWARLAGSSFYNYAGSFESVYAYSTMGGDDSAYLYDSSGDDSFESHSSWARLAGTGYYNYAGTFDRVYAYATAGGNDSAYMYDSPGNDSLKAYPSWARLAGPGYYNYVSVFDRVYAYATSGGYDQAYLYDSTGNDSYRASPDWARFAGPGYYNYAGSFDQVLAYANAGGFDQARLYDSEGNDFFYSYSNRAVLLGSSFYNHAEGFDQTYAFASEGTDQVYIDRLLENESLYGLGNFAGISRFASSHFAYDFDLVLAEADNPDSIDVDTAAIDYIFELVGEAS